MRDNPTGEWTAETVLELWQNTAGFDNNSRMTAIANAHNAALAAAREEWKRDKLPSLERALASEQHTRKTYEVLIRDLQKDLADEQEQNTHLRQQLWPEHKIQLDKAMGLTDKLEQARKLLFAVQPFCEAWQCQSLADEIKDFLDGRTKEPPPLHYKD